MFKKLEENWPGTNATAADKADYKKVVAANRIIDKIDDYSLNSNYYTIFGTFNLDYLEDDEITALLINVELEITYSDYMYQILNNTNGLAWFWVLPFATLGYFSQKRQIKSFIKNKEEYLIWQEC